MSEQNSSIHDSVVREIIDRLKQRKCRGIKANNIGQGYESPDKIASEDGSGATYVPDITSSIPSFIISVEDPNGLDSAGAAWKTFATYTRKTGREFLIAVPRSSGEKVRARLKELKIRNAKLIWY
jgi:hypothetical protein